MLTPTKTSKRLPDWTRKAEIELRKIILSTERIRASSKLGPSAAQVWHVDVQVVGRRKMASLNAAYRKKSYPTDVLSFCAPSQFFDLGNLGTIVICLPVLERQAKEFNHSLVFELRVLLIHGLLHLLGFDHERGPKDAAIMAKWEKKLLSKGQQVGLIRRLC